MDLLNSIMSGYTPILIFIFLCFAALLIFFIKLSRSLEELIRIARYDRTALMDQLAVMQSSLQDLIYYQADVCNILRGVSEEDTSTPIEANDQPSFPTEGPEQGPAYAEGTQASTAGAAAGALAGTAAGLVGGTILSEQTPGTEDSAFGDIPDFADLADDADMILDDEIAEEPQDLDLGNDDLLGDFDLTLGDTMTPDSGNQDDYDAMASETMEFNDEDYAQYSTALAEKQAKEDFKITPDTSELDKQIEEQDDDMLTFDLDDIPDESGNDIAREVPGLDLSSDSFSKPVQDDGEFSLNLGDAGTAETDFQDQMVLTEVGDISDVQGPDMLDLSDDPWKPQEVSDVEELELSLDDDDLEPESELEPAWEPQPEPESEPALDQGELDQSELVDLTFHEEPEAQVTIATNEEDDSVYLLDEPLTSEDESPASFDMQDLDLGEAMSPAAPLSEDDELDFDLTNDTIKEGPPAYETITDDVLNGDIVMDFPTEATDDTGEETEAADEFDVEPQQIDLDFQLEDESESDQGAIIQHPPHEQEFALPGIDEDVDDEYEDDEDEDVIMMEDDDAEDDDHDLDQLVDNLLDVPEDVSHDSDTEDNAELESAIILDDDDDDELAATSDDSVAESMVPQPDDEDMLPESDFAEDELVVDADAPEPIEFSDADEDDELVLDLDQSPLAEAPETEYSEAPQEGLDDEEMSTQDMMLTLDETLELDQTAAQKQDSAEDAFEGTDDLLTDNASSHEFLLEGLMDLPAHEDEHDFSFSGGQPEDPFSMQDLDITILDQDEHEGISLDGGEEEASEEDIVLPDVSFKDMQTDDSAGHAENLLELETDDLVDDDSDDLALDLSDEKAPNDSAEPDDQTKGKKSANILDFIIDQ